MPSKIFYNGETWQLSHSGNARTSGLDMGCLGTKEVLEERWLIFEREGAIAQFADIDFNQRVFRGEIRFLGGVS